MGRLWPTWMGIGVLLACCGDEKPDPTKPSTYVSLCINALTQVEYATHIEGMEVVPGAEPVILKQGPPTRVQCAVSKGTYIGGVTFDAMCDSWQADRCARVTAAVMDGRVIYLSDEAREALKTAIGKARRHPHHHQVASAGHG